MGKRNDSLICSAGSLGGGGKVLGGQGAGGPGPELNIVTRQADKAAAPITCHRVPII